MGKTILRDKALRWIVCGWTVFTAENLILSHNRDYLITNFSEKNYHTVYNSLSSLACGSILYGYWRHANSSKLNNILFVGGSKTGRLLIFGLKALGLAGIAASFPKLQIPLGFKEVPTDISKLNPLKAELVFKCPVDFKAKDVPDQVYGLERITRYPSLFALGLTSLGFALGSTTAAAGALFGYPIIFAVAGGAHQDYRFLRNGHLKRSDYDQTSLIPFMALFEGRQKWTDLSKEMKWVNVSLGIVIASLLPQARGKIKLNKN
ncbi:CAAX prenyl protease [Nowakowskiella sp. JEL0407]|nr:CAAX prenyl protease [Nowakowskiella sp. JEL0407]KAJ3121910.1 CAAX prenyl protease [Nowakowskiella sp. JEL0407]